MNKIYITIIVFFFNLPIGYSQVYYSSIVQDIIQERDTIEQFIINDTLNSEKILELVNYKNYAYFNIYGEEKLLLISGNYNDLINLFIENEKYTYSTRGTRNFNFKNNYLKTRYRFGYYFNDNLEYEINDFISINKQNILLKIDNSNLKQEDKDFVKLIFLFYIFSENYCDSINEQILLEKSKKFIKDYPNSSYLVIVNKYFNVEYESNNWGVGYYLLSGCVLPTNQLYNYFSPGTIIDIGFNFNFKNIYLFAGLGPALGGNIKKNIFYQKEWNKGDKLIYSSGEILLGYNLINKERIGITPVIGFGGAGLSPYSKNDKNYYDGVDNIIPTNSFIYGINIDFRTEKLKCNGLYDRGYEKEYSYFITRLSIIYSDARYNVTVSDLKGGVLFIKIGFAYQYQTKREIKY